MYLFQVKSKTVSEGLKQLDNAVFGLWDRNQKGMMGILCVDGLVSVQVTLMISYHYCFFCRLQFTCTPYRMNSQHLSLVLVLVLLENP